MTIIVKNGERRLRQVLEALRSLNEIILYDSGSEDETLKIASSFPNVVVHSHHFTGFGKAHNEAAALAKYPWILSIDADEVLSEALVKEIFSLQLKETCLYSIPFHNYFNGKWIKWCGWHPERHIRLYNREHTRFSDAFVHEGVLTQNMEEIKLKNPILHYPYDTLGDFLVKMQRYSTLFAKQYQYKRKASPLIALYHGVGAFLRSYVLKKGFLGGYEGFVISLYNGHTALYKYLKLYEANRSCPF